MTFRHYRPRWRRAIDRLRATLGHLIILFACTLSGAFAQEETKRKEPQVPFERFAVGARLGFSVTNTMRVGIGTEIIDNFNDFTDELESVTTISTSARAPTKRFAWGPTFQFHFTPRIGVNFELMTRVVEFTTSVTTDLEDEDGLRFLMSETQFTQARYWDVPVLVRYYMSDPGKPRAYFTGGVALRTTSSVTGSLETMDADDVLADTSDIVSVGAAPANKNVTGAAAGVGFAAVDDVGLKLEIEARFTRWFKPSFSSGLANSNQNQAEVMVGFTF